MRKDYKYMDDAVDICIDITTKGYVLSEEVVEEKDKGLQDICLALQEDYFKIEPESSMRDWYDAYLLQYKGVVEEESPTTWEEFVRGFVEGYLTIKKVIWDEE